MTTSCAASSTLVMRRSTAASSTSRVNVPKPSGPVSKVGSATPPTSTVWVAAVGAPLASVQRTNRRFSNPSTSSPDSGTTTTSSAPRATRIVRETSRRCPAVSSTAIASSTRPPPCSNGSPTM